MIFIVVMRHSFTSFLISGQVRIMVLEKENAIADWRALIGPTDAKKAKVTHPQRLVTLHGQQCLILSYKEICCPFAMFPVSVFIFHLN